MKFIEDYLTELFGVDVCDVNLNYAEPTNIIMSYSFGDDEYAAYRGTRETIVVAIVPFLVGVARGWVSAHGTVAEECKRLGGFFVGKEVFKCVEISKNIKEISDE